MKIKRFNAADMRQALQQVRETLGPDAVILSNRKSADGVELVAAIDFDETAYAAASEPARPKTPPSSPDASARVASASLAGGYDWRGVAAQPTPERKRETKPKATVSDIRPRHEVRSDDSLSRNPDMGVKKQDKEETKDEAKESAVLLEMRREMESMRRLVQNEFSMLGWGEMGRQSPELQDLFRRLMELELSADLCHGLVKKVGGIEDSEKAWRKALAVLAASLPVYEREIMDEGGVIAFIGPTGVGKTTTIAKLAARFCLRHGNRHVGLITADAYRVGGQDQINNFARLLDVPVRSVSSTRELEIALNAMSDKRLVLIDTAGMSQRDAKLNEQLAFLASERKSIRRFLTLSSNTQQSALEQAIVGFGEAKPEACVLTKVDEAASLGGVFSALIRHGLPLAFVTDGQKVPEDMHLPRTQALVNRAVNMSRQYAIGQSEQYLALALGGASADVHA